VLVEGNANLQTVICVLVARPRRCPTLSNTVLWQSWMAAYSSYTLQMFPGWPIMVRDRHTWSTKISDCLRAGKRSQYVTTSTQPSTLCGTVKWVSVFGLT